MSDVLFVLLVLILNSLPTFWGVVIAALPFEAELDFIADSSTAVPSALPKTTVLAPELEPGPFGSSANAPTIRSAKPSPFTSPAPLTE